MEYMDSEVESRTKAVYDRTFYAIANAQNPPLLDLSDLSGFEPKGTARFNVTVDEVVYECLMTPSDKRRLFVFLSDNYKIGTPERRKQAMFFRMSWHRYFPGVCLNIEDPSIKKYKNISWGGYLGDVGHFYVDGVVAIVDKIAKKYGIIYENITFLGLSSAGFAALHASAKMAYSSCIAENPQIYIKNWTDIDKLQEAMGLDFEQEIIKKRIDLESVLVRNKSSRFRIFCNSASELDFDKQLKPFLQKLGINDVKYNFYHLDNIEIYFLDTQNGHVSWLTPLSAYIASTFDGFSDRERSYLLSMIRDINRELYHLRKITLPTKYSRLYDLMKTIRLDIKNSGNDNSVNVTNLGEESANIAFPSWYRDASGAGCVIAGTEGNLHVEIECCGKGNLALFLRGLDVRGASNQRLPVWVDVSLFKIDGVTLFEGPHPIWHDVPYVHEMDVVDGLKIEVELQWKMHSYAPDEFNKLLDKLP